MYLPVSGSNRDRTADLMRFRGTSIKVRSGQMGGKSDTFESPLEPFFSLSKEIKSELNRINTTFDLLLRKQNECLRPTFMDSSDSIGEVNNLTNSINMHLQTISQKINFIHSNSPNFPDREKILSNLRQNLLESFREFSIKFKMAQQTISASFSRAPHLKNKSEKDNFDDFLSFNLGDEASARRQQQLLEERNNEEIEQIMRRAEEIRNIFMDLSNLIVEQGTVIDRIDSCITETLDNAIEAHREVEKAASYQKKSRMWFCAAALAVAVIVLLVIAIFR
ncbi:SNARE domain containing protein [Tritrichomonas foetus]|uniref:SNARE domain containing protein n=1 Tax=Tritrichomonas foetus TaxID=1144522 RepID=A0A1J4KY59_9EUKA|nr:SNARE domain containing protein [Tritrichomonas foetus]|eukprot:OHT16175.1 SNARE domain containing protein [Tritrichomonas foetus]